MTNGWQFWIDRGGTFTDVVGRSPDGRLHLRKHSSSSEPSGLDPGLSAAQQIIAQNGGPARVASIKVGTTVATNALLERRTAATVLVTTGGFGDALLIGGQHRPDIFALHIQRALPLYQKVLELDERVSVDGEVLRPLDLVRTQQQLQALRAEGWRSLAIVLLHGWQHTAHETAVANIARELHFDEVSVSHELVPLIRFVPRAGTTVLNAALAPTLTSYVSTLGQQVDAHFPGAALHFMQSSGGLVRASGFRALASILSGPAGGLIGMARLGQSLGQQRLIGFDMGGTSTDVALHDGGLPQRFEYEIGGLSINTPMLNVHTIASGGGSVLELRDGRLLVGPRSAAADPGPACYGRGGPATLTDVQVVLGRLWPEFLPHSFGPQGIASIDSNASHVRLTEWSARLGQAPQQLASAFLDVAIETMANAIRQVSTRKGNDPADFTLFAFGGAAGQHALRVAAACGMRRVLTHRLSSVLSAVGIGIADSLETRRASLVVPLHEAGLAAAAARLDDLQHSARASLEQQGFAHLSVQVERILELRDGESEVSIDIAAGSDLEVAHREFRQAYSKRFGHVPEATSLRIEAVRVLARAVHSIASLDQIVAAGNAAATALPPTARAWFDGWIDVPVLATEDRSLEWGIKGPALIVEPHSTLEVEPGWTVRRQAPGALLAEYIGADTGSATKPTVASQQGTPEAVADPARLEIFNNLFMHIAEEMGAVLQQTAQSVNIKERLDFSCALFDAEGGLVANAPHMPVHLGSMGLSVRAVIANHADHMSAGDAWMLNSPYHGGTHLPDITVVSPVFSSAARKPDFFVASRAHHADIGGVTPGSMPPFSTHIDEEGVLFEDFQLVAGGQFREAPLRQALGAARWPARNPQQNIADLRAQLAANARGQAELTRAVERHGLSTIRAYMRHVQANASVCVGDAIANLRPGRCRLQMDDGPEICVDISVDHQARRARIDFTGSSAQGAHNFNAPRAVCIAAVLYVFRSLVDRPIPLNEGCLTPLEIVIPRGSILDPSPGAAVVAGNVETSQCIVDVLLMALGVLAGSQGTMNNLTFGNADLQYYETICGGSGAGRHFDGCDAVQTHMTNSRITDAEILERRYPVRLREFSVRRGSGGAGAHHGGDGATRDIEFLRPMSGAMLANRRRVPPQGLAGGGDAACGETTLLRADGHRETLSACARFEIQAGDRIVVRTPGGGGHGSGSA